MWSGKEPLTEEERKKVYAKYYDFPIAAPDPEVRKVMTGGPIDPSKALKITDVNRLLDPGYLECERGWCVMDDGAAYVSALCEMPEVTPEMFKWWFAWHGLDDLRYRIWWPSEHYTIYVKDDQRKKILDPATPMEKRYEGVTHYLVEDFGTGSSELAINFMSPDNLGFDMSRFHSPNVEVVVCSNVQAYAPGKSMAHPIAYNTMCHFLRKRPGGGTELRTRFWFGYQMVDKKPVKLLPDGVRMPEFIPAGLSRHCMEEFTQLAAMLPRLYAELGDQPFAAID